MSSFVTIIVLHVLSICHSESYYGKNIGMFPPSSRHGIHGNVYVTSPFKLFIENFSYDGVDPSAYFKVGYTQVPSIRFGRPLSYGTEKLMNIRKIDGDSVVLESTIDLERPNRIKYLSVWSEQNQENYGSVFIPIDIVFPYDYNFGKLEGAHNVSATNVKIIDTKTIVFQNLYYDGKGPDAYFLIGKEGAPNGKNGTKVPVDGVTEVLREYKGENVKLLLPNDISFFDIKWLAIYCIRFRHNFASLNIPNKDTLNIPPHSLPEPKMAPMKSDQMSTSIRTNPIPRNEIRIQSLQRGNGETVHDREEIKIGARKAIKDKYTKESKVEKVEGSTKIVTTNTEIREKIYS